MNLISREPVVLGTAVVAVAAVFGIDMDQEEVIGTIAGAIAFAAAIRSRVSPVG